ncbi:hypothetical protein [Streptomyces cavernicola]|uniref:Lipoprotein n=1 Tax=Streptomyces cavernicola TaxID=3043613 RepID=A0ABT6S442_9ACTN|nr:hypothetical protein [Streptomyces sp. B-S-A6]MDI3402867.1 hypothetical protein [Streptomyces sp. B-S-A6]
MAALLATAAGAVLVSGCGSGKTPPGHEKRLLKAAGVTRFQITCTKDIWEATKPYDDLTEVTVVRHKGKVYTFQLTGSELVSYLKELEMDGYGPSWREGVHAQESKRMYDAISPMVDSIKPNPGPNAQVPAVTLDDAVVPTPSPKPA